MAVNQEQFDAAITDLCNRYQVPQMIVVFRDGPNVAVRFLAGTDTDTAAGEVLYDAINQMLADPKLKQRVNAAIVAARKG